MRKALTQKSFEFFQTAPRGHNPYWSSSLFNEVYLNYDLRKLRFWQEDEVGPYAQFQKDFIDLCFALRNENFESWNEADTIRNWIVPIMNLLGWHDKCPKNTNPILDNLSFTVSEGGKTKTYRPDLIYVDDPAEKPLLNVKDQRERRHASQTYSKIVLEAKAWQIIDLLDKKDSALKQKAKRKIENDDDTRGMTPEEQCLKYMNILNQDYGILSDGQTWKLFHSELSEGSTKRSFEFRLGHAKRTVLQLGSDRDGKAWEDLNESLKYFYYLFCKASHHPDDEETPLISNVLEYSKKYVDTIEDDLRDSFIGAMTIICNSYKGAFKAVPSKDELDLIRNVSESHLFNILFIKSCEVRGVLDTTNPKYYKLSLTEVIDLIGKAEFNPKIEDAGTQINTRRLAAVFKPSFAYTPDGTDLYDRLLKLYSIVQEGDFGLEIHGFKETVFEEKEWVFSKKEKISNKDMVRLLFNLGYTNSKLDGQKYQQIPYNYFTPRQLGSIYESFLEYTLLEADYDRAYFKKEWIKADLSNPQVSEKFQKCQRVKEGDLYFWIDTDLTDKKASGSYYTPDDIVQFIVKQTINPLIKTATPEAILQTKICDPSMGSGHFLNYALEHLTRYYREALFSEENSDLEEDEAESRQKILQSCLFGIDINGRAVKLAKMGLWLATAHCKRPLQNLDHQLICADAVLDGPNHLKKWKIKAIVGNPPYLNSVILSENQEYKNSLRHRYTSASGAFDICSLFLEAVSKSNCPNRIGFILPNKLISSENAKGMRDYLREHDTLTRMLRKPRRRSRQGLLRAVYATWRSVKTVWQYCLTLN